MATGNDAAVMLLPTEEVAKLKPCSEGVDMALLEEGQPLAAASTNFHWGWKAIWVSIGLVVTLMACTAIAATSVLMQPENPIPAEEVRGLQSSVSLEVYFAPICPNSLNFISGALNPFLTMKLPANAVQLTIMPYLSAKNHPPRDACQNPPSFCALSKGPMCASRGLAQPIDYINPAIVNVVQYISCMLSKTAMDHGTHAAEYTMAADLQCLNTANMAGNTLNPQVVQACEMSPEAISLIQDPAYITKMQQVEARLAGLSGTRTPFIFLNGRVLAIDSKTAEILGYETATPNAPEPFKNGVCSKANHCMLAKAVCSHLSPLPPACNGLGLPPAGAPAVVATPAPVQPLTLPPPVPVPPPLTMPPPAAPPVVLPPVQGPAKGPAHLEVYYGPTCPNSLNFVSGALNPFMSAEIPTTSVQLTVLPYLSRSDRDPAKCTAPPSACALSKGPICLSKSGLSMPANYKTPALVNAVQYISCGLSKTAMDHGARAAFYDMAADMQCLQTADVVGSTINPQAVQACEDEQALSMLQDPAYLGKLNDVDNRLQGDFPGTPAPFVFLNGRPLAIDKQTGMITGFRTANPATPEALGPCTQASPCMLAEAICSQLSDKPQACTSFL